MHVCRFSYFYESFEGFQTANDHKSALVALKYMLLSKILMNEPEEVRSIVSGKAGLKFASRDVRSLEVGVWSLSLFVDILSSAR